MLRTITVGGAFRGLHPTPFDRDGTRCTLGRETVIYGRNGSGKTTLSEVLRLGSDTGSARGPVVTASVRRGGATTSVALADVGMAIKVYNRYWVERALGLFLDGAGQSDPILKLGEVNVTAAAELERLRVLTAKLEQRAREVENVARDLGTKGKQIEQRVKQGIIDTLGPSDQNRYNTTRFTVGASKRLLTAVGAEQMDAAALAGETATACAPHVESVLIPVSPDTSPNLRIVVNEILAAEVDSERIPQLVDDRSLASWVEDGLTLHTPGQQCAFCSEGVVTATILERYRRHFSDALLALRKRIENGIGYLTSTRQQWDDYIRKLTTPDALLPDYAALITAEVTVVREQVERLHSRLEQATELLRSRGADPLVATTEDRLLPEEIEVPDIRRLHELLARNNAACVHQEERKREAQQAVERHVAATDRENYEWTTRKSSEAEEYRATLAARLLRVAARIHDLEQSQQETGAMARLLDQDLRNHFGHGHLRISVSADGTGYVVRRGSDIASDLSEGERHAIAFLYFLRSLEEEGVDPAKTIVVIDDPMTSLDKEALFAAFALGESRTESFAQTIYLTHDYEFFRLLVNNLSNKRTVSLRKLKERDAEERAFRRVSFLEIFAAVDSATGKRTSSLRTLPDGLLRHPSEYHYLFYKVAYAVQPEAAEELPLLGNAARRLLEGFISFKAPHEHSFQAKIDAIELHGDHGALRTRVVKFVHGHSHRLEPSPTAALDFPSIETELHTVLEFMRLADERHFESMCKAVGVDASAGPLRT